MLNHSSSLLIRKLKFPWLDQDAEAPHTTRALSSFSLGVTLEASEGWTNIGKRIEKKRFQLHM